MKKILPLLFVLTTVFLIRTPEASACRFSGPIPTPEDTMIGGSIFIGQTLDSGEKSRGKVLRIESGDVPKYVELTTSLYNSCSTKLYGFKEGEYFLAVTPAGEESILTNFDGDDQFTFFFETESEAENYLKELYKSLYSRNLKPFKYFPVDYIIRPNMRGEDVTNLQKGLKQISAFDILLDGIYGNQTRDAVLNFQAKQGLVVDGIAGPKTQEALRKSTTLN